MFDFVTSLLYPKKCVKCKNKGEYVCENCFSTISFLDYQVCAVCQKGTIDGLTHPGCRTQYSIDGIISAISYKGTTKKLLYQFKYSPFLSDLKMILARIMYEGLIQQESFTNFIKLENVYLIFVPLHKDRLRKRGYNQAELISRELSKLLGLKMIHLIERKLNTKPQFKLKKEERRKNVAGAFIVYPKFKEKVKEKNFLLVDDITTTGATLRECAKILKKSGARKVLGITLAHEE